MDSQEDGGNYFDQSQVVRLGYEYCNGCGVIGDSWALDTSSSSRLNAPFLRSNRGGKYPESVVEDRHLIENRYFPTEVFLSDCRTFAYCLSLVAPSRHPHFDSM